MTSGAGKVHHPAPGVSRRVLAHNADMMIVEFAFEKGAVGDPHSHPHLQATYVQSGRFIFTIDGVETDLAPGDSIIIPSSAVHSSVAVEAGSLIDTFAPRRDDFL